MQEYWLSLSDRGFFQGAALRLARFARGSGWLLYTLMLLLTTAVTALLANDGAILMLTPIFAGLLTKAYPKQRTLWLAFIFATGFFADAMSTLFIPSNLTNIIIAEAMKLEFTRFALWMLIPTLAAFATGTLAFGVRFQKQLSVSYDVAGLERAETAIRDHSVFWVGWGVLLGLVIGYSIGSHYGLPISLIAGTGALIMVLLVQLRRLRSIGTILKAAPWTILIYALGMFVVITAAFQAGIMAFLITPLLTYVEGSNGPVGALIAGTLLAGLSAAVNNLPATLIGILVLGAAKHVGQLTIYAIILGVDIGPKLTPFGSLATLLWMGILDRHQIHISWKTYFRENWWVTVVVLVTAFAGLLLSNIFLHF